MNDQDTLGSQITKAFVNSKICFSVDTFGVSGFGPDQSLFAIERFTKKYHYDLIILHLFADNDLGDIIRNNYYENANLINDGYCYLEKPYLESFLLYRAIRKIIYINTDSLFGYGKIRSSNLKSKKKCILLPLVNKYRSLEKNLLINAKRDMEANVNNKRQFYLSARYDIEFACKKLIYNIRYVNNVLETIEKKLAKLSLNKGFDYIYLIQPSEDDVTDNHPNRINKKCNDYKKENLTNIFSKIFPKDKTINLYSSFLDCNKCYFSVEEFGDDNHWSPYGIKLASRKIIAHTAFNSNK